MTLLTDLKQEKQAIIPACGDGHTFQMLANSKSLAIFLSGQLTTDHLIAEADQGLLSITEYKNYAFSLGLKKTQPLLLDLQSGFGNPLNTYYAAKELERSGADIMILSDQKYPAHHTDQPAITTAEDFIGKIRAGLDGIENPAIEIWVRLEGLHEYGIEGFKKRARYAYNAGAKAVILDHYDEADLEALAQEALPLPLLATLKPGQQAKAIESDHFYGYLDLGNLALAAHQALETAMADLLK
ncbi:isocitrate lyase/phosphoenolpyruvate mutase family protein [Aerococcus urinaeequi]